MRDDQPVGLVIHLELVLSCVLRRRASGVEIVDYRRQKGKGDHHPAHAERWDGGGTSEGRRMTGDKVTGGGETSRITLSPRQLGSHPDRCRARCGAWRQPGLEAFDHGANSAFPARFEYCPGSLTMSNSSMPGKRPRRTGCRPSVLAEQEAVFGGRHAERRVAHARAGRRTRRRRPCLASARGRRTRTNARPSGTGPTARQRMADAGFLPGTRTINGTIADSSRRLTLAQKSCSPR